MNSFKIPASNEILFLKGDINYTEFHLINGKKIVTCATLLKYQEKLNSFIRVSKSHLVNPDFYQAVLNQTLIMKDGLQISISRRKLNHVKKSLENF